MEQRETRKRVVLQDSEGVYRIIGLFDPSIHEVRNEVEFRLPGRPEIHAAKLAAVEQRLILYRESRP